MKKLWAEIQRLCETGAIHKRKRKKLKNFKPEKVLMHVGEELVELAAEPDNIDELGDMFQHLIHYAILKGWTAKQIRKEVLKKLKKRIKENK
jgi:hypothetical protein